MKFFLVFLNVIISQVSFTQTDLIIHTANCYNSDKILVLEELVVFKGDSMVKTFNLSKKRPSYSIKSLNSGQYSILYKKEGGGTENN
tara:strand:- start:248 stop:508 length:261 start_codon:yes stop_codon:yes gene_type:complete